jgi:hypothetical protein
MGCRSSCTYRCTGLLAVLALDVAVGIQSIGPGRYSDTMAVMSSNSCGLQLLQVAAHAADSNWKTPVVSAALQQRERRGRPWDVFDVDGLRARVRLMISSVV